MKLYALGDALSFQAAVSLALSSALNLAKPYVDVQG